MIDLTKDARFNGIVPFGKKIWLSSPTMHGDDDIIHNSLGTVIGVLVFIICEKVISKLVFDSKV